MNPVVEKLDRLLADLKNKKKTFPQFFDEFWITGDMIARPEMRRIVDELNALLRARINEHPEYIAYAKLASGYLEFHENNFQDSIRLISESQEIFSELKDDERYHQGNLLVGSSYRSIGEVELALHYLYPAYNYWHSLNAVTIPLLLCEYNLAEIYSESGRTDEALKLYEELIVHSEKIGNSSATSRVLNGIANVYLRQKNYPKAFDYLKRALDSCAVEAVNTSAKARTLTDLGIYYFETGDYTSAIRYQEEALQIRDDLKIRNGAVTNMVHLANIFIKQHREDEAIDMLHKALQLAEEVKVKPKMYQIHLMLCDLYETKGDLQKSLFHHRNYHCIRDEVQHDDNEKKIKNMKIFFDAEQTKKENATIKKQKEEIQHKNIKLQETIDELTITKISRKAKALTLVIAIVMFVFEDTILHFALHVLPTENYFLSMGIKLVIIFSLSPINKGIEHYLLRNMVKKKKNGEVAEVPVQREVVSALP